MKSNIPKVYLDTMIIILGSKSKENRKLIQLSKKGLLKLFISYKVKLEVRARSFEKREEADEDVYNKLYIERIQEMEKFRELERNEWRFWSQAKLERAISTFSGLIDLMGLGEYFVRGLDVKNELKLYDDLIINYGIKIHDSFHAMLAHSANMDYLLTWDNDFIKKANKVLWLKPEVLTPKDFLDKK